MEPAVTVIDDLDFGSSNVYAIGGSTLIDTGCDEQGLLEMLKENGIGRDSIRLIVNTHCHFDHVSCNRLFPKAKVCMHQLEAENVELLGREVIRSANVKVNVNRKLKDGDIVDVSKKESLKVIHTPGHTAGGICLLFGDALFTGDTVFLGAVGRTDLPTGDAQELEKSIRKLAKLPFKTIYPGHGPSAEKSEVFG